MTEATFDTMIAATFAAVAAALAWRMAEAVGSGGELTLPWVWVSFMAVGAVGFVWSAVRMSAWSWRTAFVGALGACFGRAWDIADQTADFGGDRAWLGIGQWIALGIVWGVAWTLTGLTLAANQFPAKKA